MKKSSLSLLLCLVLLLAGAARSHAQRKITVSGGCIVGSVVLTEDGTNFGKPYFSGTGTVGIDANIAITITWISSGGINSWFLRFSGSPYFEYGADTPLPPSNSTGVWVKIQQNDFCPSGGAVLSVSGSGTQALPGVPLTLSTPTVTNVACNGGSTGAISVTASGGTRPYTYTLGEVSNTTGSFTGLPAGSYTVTVGDANGGTSTSSVIVITEPAALTAYLTTETYVSCNGGSDGSFAITAEGGKKPYTYYFDEMSNTTGIFVGISAGDHTFSVQDACGKTVGNILTVTEPTALTATLTNQANVSCNGGSDGSFTVTASGGTGLYTYTLGEVSNITGTFGGLSVGIYMVAVEDANGCTTTSSAVEITQPAAVSAPTLSADPGNTTTNQPITVTASGCGGTVNWSAAGGTDNNDGTYTFAAPGNYDISATCTVQGCTSPASETLSLTIGGCPSISLNTDSQANVNCFGGSDGSFIVTASGGTGPYTYTLGEVSNTTGSFGGLSAGSYTVAVEDANGCESAIQDVTVAEPASLPTFTATTTSVSCKGGFDGSISVTAGDGTGPYTYSKGSGANYGSESTFTGLAAGTYGIRVKDANGCESDIQQVTVNQPPALIVSVSGNTSVTFGFGENCTTLTASASGGTGLYSYLWSSGGTDASEQVCPGQNTQTYTVTGTDANGCMASQQVTVNVNDLSCGNKSQYVTICYYGVTQCVSEKIAQRYLKLGATLGGCRAGNARINLEPEASDLPLHLSLQAYPNPVSDVVTLQVLAPRTGLATFEVIDLMGRMRQSRNEQLTEGLNQVEIRLGTLPTGIYFIRARDGFNHSAAVRVSRE